MELPLQLWCKILTTAAATAAPAASVAHLVPAIKRQIRASSSLHTSLQRVVERIVVVLAVLDVRADLWQGIYTCPHFFITHVHTYSVHRYVEAHVRTPFLAFYMSMACMVMACMVIACIVMAAHLLLPFRAHLRVVAKLCPAYVCMRTNVHACVHVCAALRARVCMCA